MYMGGVENLVSQRTIFNQLDIPKENRNYPESCHYNERGWRDHDFST